MERALVAEGPRQRWPIPRLPKASGFALRFGLLSAVLLGCYYFPYPERSSIKPWLDGFLRWYAASAGLVIRVFEPDVRVVGQEIFGRYSLRIVKTCDAMDVTILLVSAILAFPGPWKRRLLGAAIGIGLLFVINVLRICSLYYIGIFFPSFFEVAHVDLWPAFILLGSVVFFWAVIARSRVDEKHPEIA